MTRIEVHKKWKKIVKRRRALEELLRTRDNSKDHGNPVRHRIARAQVKEAYYTYFLKQKTNLGLPIE